MSRSRTIAVLTTIALLLSIPGTAHAEEAERAGVAEAGESGHGELTNRQVRRALPTARSFGAGTDRSTSRGNAFCGASVAVGPAPVASAGATYTNTRTQITAELVVEEHQSSNAAKQRFRAVRRQVRANCDGFVVGGFEYEVKRSSAVRRMGQQTFATGFRVREISSGRVFGETLVNVHRIGRFIVLANVVGGNTLDPTLDRRLLRRSFRSLEAGVRAL